MYVFHILPLIRTNIGHLFKELQLRGYLRRCEGIYACKNFIATLIHNNVDDANKRLLAMRVKSGLQKRGQRM
jgi:hypothetical protein